MQKKGLVASSSRIISSKGLKHVSPLKPLIHRSGPPASQLAFFLVEVAALEVVRRFSRSKCPLIWKGIQALQILCYPPFKWLGKWSPIKMMIENVQRISKPLLLLSIATAFSEHPESSEHLTENVDDTQPNCEITITSSDSDISENSSKDEPENWMIQLIRDLNKQGIHLPERINEDELQRFYDAANGDFSCLMSSLKRTIRWRETYHILSLQELENWSHLVFWHGFDVMLRPCLVIRLGLACSNLVPHERPRFAQAVVSQVEHGILHLINEDDPRITVLMDCDGISPFRFPMQMMRSCTTVVQDNFPNRLASLIVIRLPPVVRVLAQTLIQILKPTTRQKLRIEGESYRKALSEFLHTVPAFLGGSCSCSHCERLCAGKLFRQSEGTSKRQPCGGDLSNDEAAGNQFPVYEAGRNNECDHYLRAAIVAFLMIWVIIAFLVGMYDPETFSALSHEV